MTLERDVPASSIGDVFRKKPGDKATVDGSLLGLLLAYACAYCYTFCLFGGNVFLPASLFAFSDGILCRIVLLVVGAVVLVAWQAVDFEPSRAKSRAATAVSLVFSLAPALAPLAVSLTGIVAVAYVCWGLAGVTCAYLYIKLTPWMCVVSRGNALAFVALGNIVACAMFALVGLLVAPAGLVVAAVLPFVAAFVGIRSESSQSIPVASGIVGKHHHARQAWDALLYTLVQCIGLGFGIYCVLAVSLGQGAPVGPLAYACATLVASMVLLVDWKTRRALDEERGARYLYLMLAVPLLVVVFLRDDWALLACGCVLIALMWVTALIGCSSEAESVRANNLASQSAMARSWGLSLLGMAIGLAVGFVGIGLAGAHSWVLGAMVGVGFVVVLAMMTVISSPRADQSKRARLAQLQSKEGRAAASPVPAPPGVSGEQAAVGDAFVARCNEISDSFGLSNRQREVFFLLARGRDSKYIQKELVISKGTADSHIHNIYRKLDVHSHQELLDLFEGER